MSVHNGSYKVIDVTTDKEEWNEIKKPESTFPTVVMHGLYIGGYKEIQDLEDMGFLGSIIQRGMLYNDYLTYKFYRLCSKMFEL